MSAAPEPLLNVTFTFEGRTLRARSGQSIASALMESGTPVLTRSFKYHRPRGYTCGYDICGNCPVTVNGLPGVSACVTPVSGGEQVHRERGWPTAERDFLRFADVASRYLSAGFQFQLFRKQPRLAKKAERVMAHLAGAGRFPSIEAARAIRTVDETASPEVLVVGGGVSGCAAALGAASTGVSVMLAQRGPLGGRGHARSGSAVWQGSSKPVPELTAAVVSAVGAEQEIEVVAGTALSWFEGGVLPVISGNRFIEVRPSRLIVATGSYDVPALFPGNDKPGVVLADGVSRMLRVDRVVPWRRAVVLTDCERGSQLVQLLDEAGVEVVALVDQSGGRVTHGAHIVGRIRAARGLKQLREVDVEVDGAVRTFRADLLCVALRERPADDLALQWEYVNAGTPSAVRGGWAPRNSDHSFLAVVGSAAGWGADDPERAFAAGADAVASLRAAGQ